MLRGAALRRHEPRRRAARARPALDLPARRVTRHPRIHALLARAARRMALERHSEPAARGHRKPAPLVRVRHLQLRELGARHLVAARGALGAPRRATAPARAAARRAVPRRPRAHGLPPAAPRPLVLVAPTVLVFRPFPSSLSAARLHAVPRDGHQRLSRLDRPPSRRRRRVGRYPTAVDLQPHGAQRRRLRAYASRNRQRPGGARLALVVRARRHAAHSSQRVAGLGHAARVARDARLRPRVHAGDDARARLGARERGSLSTETGRRRSKGSNRAAGHSSAPTCTTPTSTTRPSR